MAIRRMTVAGRAASVAYFDQDWEPVEPDVEPHIAKVLFDDGEAMLLWSGPPLDRAPPAAKGAQDEDYVENLGKALEDARAFKEKEIGEDQASGTRHIILVRHGKTELNDPDPKKDRIRGHEDVPLNRVGRREARELGEELADSAAPDRPDVLVSSDLSRARETAEIISEETGIPIRCVSDGFRPWNVGTFVGMVSIEAVPVLTNHYMALVPDDPVPGGESFCAFRDRFFDWLAYVLFRFPGVVGVVAHHRNERLLAGWEAAGYPADLNIDIPTFGEEGESTGKCMAFDIPIRRLLGDDTPELEAEDYDPGEKRVPKGSPEGGEWTTGGGGGVANANAEELKHKPISLVFSGSFNPPGGHHESALNRARAALQKEGYTLAHVIVAPSPDRLMQKKLGKGAYSLADRVELAKRQFGNEVEVLGGPAQASEKVEGKPRRTDTAKWVKARYPDTEVVALTGNDDPPAYPGGPDLETTDTLYKGAEGTNHAGYYYLSLTRPKGGMSSTKIRAALAKGEPIPEGALKPETAAYLEKMGVKAPVVPTGVEHVIRTLPEAEFKAAASKRAVYNPHLPPIRNTDELLTQLSVDILDQESRPTTESSMNTPEREKLQREITDTLWRNRGYAEPNKHHDLNLHEPIRHERRIHVILGPSAAGKSGYLADPLVRDTGAVLVDADESKRMLPEFDNGRGANAVHEESSKMAERILLKRAMQEGANIVLPMIGKNLEKVRGQLKSFSELGYQVHLHLVDLPIDKAVHRAVLRYISTGRLVRPGYIHGIDGLPRKTYDTLKGEPYVATAKAVSTDVPEGAPAVPID